MSTMGYIASSNHEFRSKASITSPMESYCKNSLYWRLISFPKQNVKPRVPVRYPTCAMKESKMSYYNQLNDTMDLIDKNNINERKRKIVFVMGATATGKSKLSIELATHFGVEIINADKIQVYKGLGIATNIVPESKRKNVPHHLFGFLDPNVNWTVTDYCNHVNEILNRIENNNGLHAIFVGCSNSFIEALVEQSMESNIKFRNLYDCCFLWVDVALPVLKTRISRRTEEMVASGLIEEIREIFGPDIDLDQGVWRVIGVSEFAPLLHAELDRQNTMDDAARKMMLQSAVFNMKENTFKLALKQIGKIRRLEEVRGWKLHRIDATRVFGKEGQEAKEIWEDDVLKPSLEIIANFLQGSDK